MHIPIVFNVNILIHTLIIAHLFDMYPTDVAVRDPLYLTEHPRALGEVKDNHRHRVGIETQQVLVYCFHGNIYRGHHVHLLEFLQVVRLVDCKDAWLAARNNNIFYV